MAAKGLACNRLSLPIPTSLCLPHHDLFEAGHVKNLTGLEGLAFGYCFKKDKLY
jgi:hypothetical protein